MEVARYLQSKSYKSKHTSRTLVFLVNLVYYLSVIDGQTCPPTKHESITVEFGVQAHLRVLISSIWPNTGEDVVMRNDEGQVEGACSGRKSHPGRVLQGITCWSRKDKGFSIESDGLCLSSCYIDIKMSLTEHSTSGTFHLELNETRCQFLNVKIYYRDFTPACSVWYHGEIKYFIFSCSWIMGERNGTTRLLSGDLTVNNTEYKGIRSNQSTIMLTCSAWIGLEDMFSESKVPDICVVSESGFEQNCTFSHITQVSMDGIEEGKTTTGTINCCTDSNIKPDVLLFNETYSFVVDSLGGPYKQEHSGTNMTDIKIGIVCSKNTVSEVVTYSVARLISNETITVIIANASENNTSDMCSYRYTIIATRRPFEHSNSNSTSNPQTTLSTIKYERDSVTGPLQSPMYSTMQTSSSASRLAPIPSSSESQHETSSKPFMNITLIPLLVLPFLLLLLGAGSCLWVSQRRFPKLKCCSSPDQMGSTGSHCPELQNTTSNESGDGTFQMVPLSSTSHPNTIGRIPPRIATQLNGEGNLVLNEKEHSRERTNPLGTEENHYQNLDKDTSSEADYGAYSSIDNVYYSLEDTADPTHEQQTIHSDSWPYDAEMSQSTLSLHKNCEIEGYMQFQVSKEVRKF